MVAAFHGNISRVLQLTARVPHVAREGAVTDNSVQRVVSVRADLGQTCISCRCMRLFLFVCPAAFAVDVIPNLEIRMGSGVPGDSMIASSLAKNLTPTAEGAAVGKTSGRGLARCFPDRYADGLWVASNATLSYRMALETWQYGMCDRSRQNHRSALEAQSAGVADVLLPTRSDPYEWKPRDDSCALPRLDTATVCALLRGRRIMFVGDSVIMSVFYSIALALQAKTSMDSKGINRRAIVHCGNNATVKFSAVRNDHLQLPGEPRPTWVTGYTPSGNWLLHEPDFTVMASGLHDVTRGG